MPKELAVLVAILSIICFFSVFRPAFSLVILIIMLGLEQWLQSKKGIFLSNPGLANLIFAAAFMFCFIIAGFRLKLGITNMPKKSMAVFLLITYALISYFWTIDHALFLEKWADSAPYILLCVLLAPLMINSVDDIQVFGTGIILVGTVVLLLLAFDTPWSYRGIELTYDVRGNPLEIGTLAGQIGLAAILMSFTGTGRLLQLFRWAVVILAVYVAILSGSRGQVLAMALCAIVFLPISRDFNMKTGCISSVIGLAAIGGVIWWGMQQVVGNERWQVGEMAGNYDSTRLGMAAHLTEYWLSSGPLAWVFGIGNTSSASSEVLGIHPHIVPLEILAEEGIIGLALFAAVMYWCGKSFYQCYMRVRKDARSRSALCLIACLLVYNLMLSMKQGTFLESQYLLMFSVMLLKLCSILVPSDRVNDGMANA